MKTIGTLHVSIKNDEDLVVNLVWYSDVHKNGARPYAIYAQSKKHGFEEGPHPIKSMESVSRFLRSSKLHSSGTASAGRRNLCGDFNLRAMHNKWPHVAASSLEGTHD